MSPIDVEKLLKEANKNYLPVTVSRNVPYEVDIKNLAVFDYNQYDANIQPVEKVRDAVQALVYRIWEQPMSKSEDGTLVLAELPSQVTDKTLHAETSSIAIQSLLPREKHVPKQKEMTKWERFAKEKGINKHKKGTEKSKFKWDDQVKDYVPTHGYNKNKSDLQDWCIEVPDNADPYQDQYAAKKQEKKERIAKNEMQRVRNLEHANSLMTGDPKSSKSQRKQELERQLKLTKTSTASLGKFDKQIENEKLVHKTQKTKRKFQETVGNVALEKEKSQLIIQKLNQNEAPLDIEKGVGKFMFKEQQKQRMKRTKK